jgi:phosphatidate cytidylyltransferase
LGDEDEDDCRMRTRIISGFAGAPLLLGAILWPGGEWLFPGWPFAALVLAMILVGLREFYDGCRASGRYPLDWIGYAAGLLLWFLATPYAPPADLRPLHFGLTAMLMLSLAQEALRGERRAPLQNLAPTWLGALYVGWLMSMVLRLRLYSLSAQAQLNWMLPADWMDTAGAGAMLVLFTVLCTVAVDTGAYFVGKAIGKRKLAPVLSPGKTVEGAVGGFAFAVVLALLLGLWLKLPLGFCAAAGVLIGILAQLGDLSKSAIKREIGVKDFGKLIPGHGGVLDRFDSLMFTGPAVYWLVVFWGR